MGPIQSSLNQLTLSTFGAIGAVSHALKGSFKKPQAPKPQAQGEPVSSESNWNTGNIAKIGRNYANRNIKSYQAAALAVDSANDMIIQKSVSQNAVANRLAKLKAATSLTTKKEGGSK